MSQHDRDEAGYGDAGYKEMCGRALAALALALASSLTLLHLAFLPLAAVALALSVSALRRIRDLSPELGGRRVALAALALSLIFAITGPLEPLLYNFSMRAQAVEMSYDWFAALRNDDAQTAMQLSVAKWLRSSSGISVEKYLKRLVPPGTHQAYPEKPAVKLLLTLGKSAQVKLIKHVSVVTNDFDDTDRVVDVYEIRDGQAADPVPAYMKLTVTRRLDLITKRRSWEVTKAELIDDPSQAEPREAVAADDGSDEDLTWREKVRRKLERKKEQR